MSYFSAVLARTGRAWTVHDLDLESLADLSEVADELRDAASDDDEPVLLLVEREDSWWALVRVDGEEDPRVFVSDRTGVAASPYAELLDVPVGAADAPADGACAGDLDLLADLGTPPARLRGMCDEELLPTDALTEISEGAGFAEVLDSLR